MLSNSPGGVNFESAPFKLTRELLEVHYIWLIKFYVLLQENMVWLSVINALLQVMDSDAEGTASEFFDYFKVGIY